MEMRTQICFVASSGGHLDEIRMLKKMIERYPCSLVTEKEPYEIDFYGKPVHYIHQMNRKEIRSYISFFKSFHLAKKIFTEEKTTCVITTGAMCAIPFCILAKRMGIPVIYVESFARIDSPSLTGRILYRLRIPSLFLIQWPALKKFYPKAKYEGSLF